MTDPGEAAALDARDRMAAGTRALRDAASVLHRETAIANAAPPLPKPALSGRRLALTVVCPWCKAQPDVACRLFNLRPMKAPFHPGRLKAAEAAQAARSQT